MELRHIRYFLAVAQELNFTKAARKLSMAQPPLSRQIQELEAELGVTLFVRHPRTLQLTQEGLHFKQYAQQILGLTDKAAEELREMHHGLRGTLYLATVEGRGPWLLAQWIADFQQKYPLVQYNLWNGNSDDVIDRVMNRLCDLAIILEPHNGEGLHSLCVFEEPWIALIPSGNPLSRLPGDAIDLAQLAPYDLIVPSRASRIREIEGWFQQSGHTAKIRCQVAHMINAWKLAQQGVGIAIYPSSAAAFVQDGSVCVKQLAAPSVKASYALVWKKEHQLSRVAQTFLESLLEQKGTDKDL